MDDQRADAALISGDGLLGEALERWIKRGHATPAPPTVRQIVVTYRVGHAYSRIVVLDPQIEPVFASPARGPALGLATLTLARRALREDRVVFSDLFLDERGRPMMEFLAPVRDLTPSPRARLGVYVLQIVPATFLFPLIQTWPTPSETAETLLVEKRGGRVVYLNDLRHRDDAALKLAAPPSADERPAMLAAQGRRGVVAGLDYRRVRVLASVAPVGGHAVVPGREDRPQRGGRLLAEHGAVRSRRGGRRDPSRRSVARAVLGAQGGQAAAPAVRGRA